MPGSRYDKAAKVNGVSISILHMVTFGLQFEVNREIILPWWGWIIVFIVLASKEILASRTVKKFVQKCCKCACCGTCLMWTMAISGLALLLAKQILKCDIYEELSDILVAEFWINWVVAVLYLIKILILGLICCDKTRLQYRDSGQNSRQRL